MVRFLLLFLVMTTSAHAAGVGTATGTVGTSHKSYVPIIEGRSGLTNSGAGFGFAPIPRDGGSYTHLTVDNLNDSGAGSLRAALESSTSNRMITCNVSGRIRLASNIAISTGNMIFAGETCPSPGLTYSDAMILPNADNIVFSHIRCQTGELTDVNSGNGPDQVSCVEILDGDNQVYSHMTTMWNTDEGIGSFDQSDTCCFDNIIIMDNIFTEGTIAKASLCDNATMLHYRNLFKRSEDRNPRWAASCRDKVVNNFFYDIRFGSQAGESSNFDVGDRALQMDLISNRYLEHSAGLSEKVVYGDDLFTSATIYVNDNNQVNSSNPTTGDDFTDHVTPGTTNIITESSTPHSELEAQGLEIIELTNTGSPLWDEMKNTVGARAADRDADDNRAIDEVQDCIDGVTCVENDPVYDYDWAGQKSSTFGTITANVRGSGGIPSLTVPSDPWGISSTGRTNIEQMAVNCAALVGVVGGSECQ